MQAFLLRNFRNFSKHQKQHLRHLQNNKGLLNHKATLRLKQKASLYSRCGTCGAYQFQLSKETVIIKKGGNRPLPLDGNDFSGITANKNMNAASAYLTRYLAIWLCCPGGPGERNQTCRSIPCNTKAIQLSAKPTRQWIETSETRGERDNNYFPIPHFPSSHPLPGPPEHPPPLGSALSLALRSVRFSNAC